MGENIMRKKTQGRDIKGKISQILDMPEEVIFDIPKMVVIGKKEIRIENYKGILEYDDRLIRINTSMGAIAIEGEGLDLKNILREEISVTGRINHIRIA